MRRSIAALSVLCMLMAFGAVKLYAADTKTDTWHGVITDDMCGKKHMEMKNDEAKACALKCVEKGGKFALYDPTSDKVFVLSDQSKAKEFAAEHVVVMGSLSEDGKTITVTSIQKGEGKKEGKKTGR